VKRKYNKILDKYNAVKDKIKEILETNSKNYNLAKEGIKKILSENLDPFIIDIDKIIDNIKKDFDNISSTNHYDDTEFGKCHRRLLILRSRIFEFKKVVKNFCNDSSDKSFEKLKEVINE